MGDNTGVMAKQMSDPGNVHDVVFVGSGLSSSYTLVQLLDQLGADFRDRPLRVAVIEKADHFFTGIPYGDRSGAASLIITPVKEFLPSPEREDFMAWFARNRNRVLADIEAKEGALSGKLLEQSKDAIAAGDCSEFHIPRYVFGTYLSEKTQIRIDDARREGRLDCRMIQGEVMDIRRGGDGYSLDLGDGRAVSGRLVVLALGTAPNRTIFGEQDLASTKACLIEDPYLPGMETTLQRIQDFLCRPGAGERPHVLLVGANAACLEMLYNLSDLPALQGHDLSFHVMAPQGKLPDRFRQIAAPRLEAAYLNALKDEDNLSADAILDAVKADLASAETLSLGISDTLPKISQAVGALLAKLSLQEKKAFVRDVGIEIGRLQRRAGDEYSDIADDLKRRGRLEIVAGRFAGLTDRPTRGVEVVFEASIDGKRRSLPTPIDVVVNCTGSAGLSRPNASPLIEALLANGLCEANESGFGFVVNDRMEAADDLFVIGPLLAGNVVQDLSIWHVEHCGRIIEFSKTLAQSIHGDLLKAA